MIQGIPGQRQNKGPHLKDYGCKVHTLLAMGMDKYQELLTPDQIRRLTIEGFNNGFILDNDIPTDQPGWYRVFVRDSAGFVNHVWPKARAHQICKNNYLEVIPDEYDYLEIEWSTATGSHFGLGEMVRGEVKTVYDPWPGLRRLGIKSLRFWRFQ